VVAVLDYGTGACDTTALLTVGDKQVEISLAGKEAKSENGIPWKGKSKGGKGHK
jgi:hypothetical protein